MAEQTEDRGVDVVLAHCPFCGAENIHGKSYGGIQPRLALFHVCRGLMPEMKDVEIVFNSDAGRRDYDFTYEVI